MKLKWKCDQREQIKRGIEPLDDMEIDINLADLTPEERVELAEGRTGLFVEGTTEEVKTQLQALVLEKKKKEEQEAQMRVEFLESLKTMKIVECDEPISKSFANGRCVVTYVGYRVATENVKHLWNFRSDFEKEVFVLKKQAAEMTQQSLDAAVNEAKDRIAEAEEELKKEKEREETEKKERYAEKLKRRAEIGAVEIEISRGGREWGTPWGALVTSVSGKENYDFSVSVYDLSKEILTIKCSPGDVIAWGQKNFRNARRTIHERRKVCEDWSLCSM